MDANEVKAIREDIGITQEEMARRLKCTARTIFNLEHGKTRPTKVMIRRLQRQKEKRK